MSITVALMTSCLKDNDDTMGEGYSDSAIISFSLGNLRQTRDTISKRGTDSTYTVRIKGEKFKFHIDQNNSIIYNPDSLPYGTSVARVLTTITAKSAGSIMWKSVTSDSTNYYSSNDSVDLRQERTLRVYAQNRTGYRDYRLRVNVHKQKPDVFVWTSLGSNADLGALTAAKAVVYDEQLFVFGERGGQTVAYRTALTDGTTWTALPVVFSSGTYKSVVVHDGQLYLSEGGTVRHSADGMTWQMSSMNADLAQLVASSSKELYGLSTNGGLIVSKDGGATWSAEQLDDRGSLLPSDNISYVCQAVTTNDSVDRVLLVGSAVGHDKAVAWTKLSDYSYNAPTYSWSFVDVANNRYSLPVLSGLALAKYDKGVLALGMKDGKMVVPFISKDSGITWTTAKNHTLPADATGFTTFAATVDSSSFIWVIGDGKVWRGRLNRLGWTDTQKSFEK